ncbi:MAG: histidine kinase dimerization/phosphoacceptor domain -containing protein [Rhizorhabdus sp.]
MNWLAGWDFPSRTAPALPVLVAQAIFAMLVTIAMILVRMTIDMISLGAGPFVLISPTVMVATLFGRWFSGAIALLLSLSYTVYFVLPVTGNFTLEQPGDVPRLLVNIFVGAATMVLLEIFRGAVSQANAERDRQIEQRELLLAELDHRVKNNFAAVSGLLRMQAQRATDPVVREELGIALNRVEGIATAHRFLYRDGSTGGEIDMAPYLEALCAALRPALLNADRVGLECRSDAVRLDRDRAISIGLIINELVTNAARHAFPDGRAGIVSISLAQVDGAIELVVQDDGCGLPVEPRAGSLGRRLISAFVREARGEMSVESSPTGTRCSVLLR